MKIFYEVLHRNMRGLFYLGNFMKNSDFRVVVESGG